MIQGEMIDRPISSDVFTLLRLFENERGVDVGQNFLDLLQNYHSVYDEPKKRPKTSWSANRLRNALEKSEASGLIEDGKEWLKDWKISAIGLEVRKAETVRSMRSAGS